MEIEYPGYDVAAESARLGERPIALRLYTPALPESGRERCHRQLEERLYTVCRRFIDARKHAENPP